MTEGQDVILDTLITGKPLSDSIVLKNGQDHVHGT